MCQGIPKSEDSLWLLVPFFHHVSESWGIELKSSDLVADVFTRRAISPAPSLTVHCEALVLFNKCPCMGYRVKVRDSSSSLSSCWSYYSFNKPNDHCVVRPEGQRGAQKTPCNDGVYCHVVCRAWVRESQPGQFLCRPHLP